MKIIYILTFFGIAISSCESQTKSVALEDYYTSRETLELQKLIDFVDQEITKNCVDSKLDCYNLFFDQFENLEANADLQLPLSKTGELHLLQTLDPSIFNDIWRYCEYKRSYKKDSSIFLQSICLNPKGRFSKFLINLTKDHEKLNNYGRPFEITGDYTPAMNGILLKNHDSFDIESQNELFLMAIHLLTLNYPEKVNKN